MKRIDVPDEDDAATARAICLDRGWSLQEPAWLASYDAYVVRRGNPKRMTKAVVVPDIGDELYGLYDGPVGKRISGDIRDAAVGACPMCGSASTGTVDHFLPRKHYPEFSIFGPNLVPACSLCNMFAKRTTFQGPLPHEHLLHPHFDRLLDHPIWKVAFIGNLKAVTFRAVPIRRLSTVAARRVEYHLATVLKREFRKAMRAEWVNHAEGVGTAAKKCGLRRLTRVFFVRETESRLDYASTGGNHNSWTAAFLRGVLDDAAATGFLRARAAAKLRA